MGKDNQPNSFDISESTEAVTNHNSSDPNNTVSQNVHIHKHNSYHSKHHRHRFKHHRKHSFRKNKKIKFLALIKRNKSIVINIFSCLVSIVLIILLATNLDKTDPVVTEPVRTDITQSTIKIETSIYSDKISLVSNAVSYYMNKSNDCTATEAYKAFDGYKGNLNFGLPVTFIYRVTGLPVGVSVESAKLDVSENETYQAGQTFSFNVIDGKIDLYNLKTGTQYYYRLNLSLNNNSVIGTVGSFETDFSPRILNIDGAVNVRDIGGWDTVDGKKIRQGLLLRGSELDGAIEPDYLLTDKGLQQMIGNLGVRFDMDLRPSTDNPSGTDALGNNVIHKYYNTPMYSDILKNSSSELVKNVFSDLADPDNYPIYLHCTYGRDRTGTICYLLEALLGLSDEDLLKEYELSLFTDSYLNYSEFKTFTEQIKELSGDTTQQKVENWLLSTGVTTEQIVSIRKIFLNE